MSWGQLAGFAVRRFGVLAAVGGVAAWACSRSSEPENGKAEQPPSGGVPKPASLLPDRLNIPANKFRGPVLYLKRPDATDTLSNPATLVDTKRLLGYLIADPSEGGGLFRHTSIACRENDTLDYYTQLIRRLPFAAERIRIEQDDLVARSKAAKDFCDPDAKQPFEANNLHIEIEGNDPDAPSYLFSFHPDCHPSYKPPAEPVIKDGVIRSSSGEPLCGDDLAGAAMALEAVRVALDNPNQIRFSKIIINAEVAEEIGVKGAKRLDPKYMAADMVFILDGRDLNNIQAGGGDIHFATLHIEGIAASMAAARIIAGAEIGVRGLYQDNPRTIINIDEVRSAGSNPETVGGNFNSVAPYAEIRLPAGTGISLNQVTTPPGIKIEVTPDSRVRIFGKSEHASRAADAANACVFGAKLMASSILAAPFSAPPEFWCGVEGKGPKQKKPYDSDRLLAWQLRNLDVTQTDQYVADFDRRAREICSDAGVKCTTGGLGRVVKGFSIDRNGALATVVKAGFRAAGIPVPPMKDDFGGSAANEFAARGEIDAVNWPLGEGDEHTPNEHLMLDQFYRSTQALVGAMLVLSQYRREER